jgi:DNA-binding XRE family transcriptional regulator
MSVGTITARIDLAKTIIREVATEIAKEMGEHVPTVRVALQIARHMQQLAEDLHEDAHWQVVKKRDALHEPASIKRYNKGEKKRREAGGPPRGRKSGWAKKAVGT